MKELYSLRGLDVFQKDLHQIVLRGKGDEKFKEIINNEISLSLPPENLKIIQNDKFLLAKHSFDQWNLFYLDRKEHKEVLKIVSNFNSNEEILASDYSREVYVPFIMSFKNGRCSLLERKIILIV